MNSERDNEFSSGPLSPAEETLRLIASLPAPEGMAERVHEKLRSTSRSTHVLKWPLWLGAGTFRYSAVMRGVTAAAIVLIVAGGGWSIYSHVQPLSVGPAIAAPARIGGGGFSSAGAMRKPDSPNGAVITHGIKSHPATDVATPRAPHPQAAQKRAKKHTKAAPLIAQPH